MWQKNYNGLSELMRLITNNGGAYTWVDNQPFITMANGKRFYWRELPYYKEMLIETREERLNNESNK
jgi:hypothetical protein